MGFDHEACNTGLGLSLGCQGNPDHHTNLQAFDLDHQKKKKIQLKYDHLLPALTLGPSSGASKIEAAKSDDHFGAVSSFSNSSSFKRDRGLGVEEIEGEVEEERVVNITTSSRVSDELYDQDQDHEGSPRKKLRLTKEQSATLEDTFREHTTLNPKQKQELARKLNLRPRQVEVWFQNRRARTKLKQTEAECELLKQCCETLKEENRRLHKELQELKLMKQTATAAAPFYMQFPTATLTMCPSCEKICNVGDHHNHNHNESSTSPFLVGSNKNHLIFNPYSTHPSTAC
ncbi:homeobox-leucine zipper protein HAT22-like [Pyrus ussuriensis x Pyrus communis]|uniref:Homeobox-leucine zipper protein HAT22-like n=1 Tax=Pyrus ussuriensis x Pyrus communis TaxID=2448454 RepID=A0A5N5HLN1_9ROSA|nr:homeobox-leucine zipper protein HAT22-like [Pyrus ussuriensis x Pyrus communis]